MENTDMMANKIIGSYINGNYKVVIFEDGTKLRVTPDSEFIPTRVESLDCKITQFCDMNCPQCFKEDTLIMTNSGYKKIGDLKCGDMVLSYNIEKNIFEFKPITRTFKNEYEGEMINISKGNFNITCTPNHKIFTKNKGYVEAKNLVGTEELVIF